MNTMGPEHVPGGRVAHQHTPGCSGHGACFYLEREHLVGHVHDHVRPVLRQGHGGMIIATSATVSALKAHVSVQGGGFAEAFSSRRLLVFDAEHCLRRLMVDGMPAAGLFRAFIGGQLLYLGSHHVHLHLYDEMVGLLCERGQFEAAVRLEELWNALAVGHSFDLLCGHAMDTFARARHAREREAIRLAHTYLVRC